MIKISLEVTPHQLLQIAQLLNTSPESISEPTSNEKTSDDSLPTVTVSASPKHSKKTLKAMEEARSHATPKPAPKSKVAMPVFGRTQQQIDAHIEKEANRLEELSEEEELKQQRREERAAAKAEKEAEEAKQKQEIVNIKAAVITPSAIEAPMPKKPWEL